MVDAHKRYAPNDPNSVLSWRGSRQVGGLAPTPATVTAQAVGRVRVSSTAVGASIPTGKALRATTPNSLRRARLASRLFDVREANVNFSPAASGRVRLRSTARPAAITTQAQIRGRIRVRSRVAGGPIQTSPPMKGRIRLYSRSTGFSGAIIPGRIILIVTGTVYVAPVGSPAPTAFRSTLDPVWQDMGYVSGEGVTFRDDWDVEPKSSWTSLYPKEFVMTSRRVTAAFALREYNKRAVEFVLEGSITKNVSEWKKPAFNDTAVPRALVIDFTDVGTGIDGRLYFPSGVAEADVESQYTRTTSADLPIVFGASQTNNEPPYTLWREGFETDAGSSTTLAGYEYGYEGGY